MKNSVINRTIPINLSHLKIHRWQMRTICHRPFSLKFFQEINDTIRAMPDDLVKMLDIGNRHQVTFMAPGAGA
jgi:hypothetical protein